MELYEFFEKYLPNYEEKVRPYYMSKGCLVNAKEFYDRYFPEALQNYTNIVCKKQRENCIESIPDEEFRIEDLMMTLYYAEQPKIEDL